MQTIIEPQIIDSNAQAAEQPQPVSKAQLEQLAPADYFMVGGGQGLVSTY